MHDPFILKLNKNNSILQRLIENGIVEELEVPNISKEEIEEIMKNYTHPKLEEPKFTISLESDYLLDPEGNKVDFKNLLKNN